MTKKDKFLEVHFVYPSGEHSKTYLTPPGDNQCESEYIRIEFLDKGLWRCKILFYQNVYLTVINKEE